MIIYLDIILFINSLMTTLLILVSGKFFDLKIRWKKIIIAVFIADLYTLYIFQISNSEIIFLSILLNFIVAGIIVLISFYPINLNDFVKVIISFYFFTFLIIGAGISINNLRIYNGRNIFALIFSILLLIFFLKYGWKYHKKRFKPDELYLPLCFEIEEEVIEITVFVDTGNEIYDPLTKNSVIVINILNLEESFFKNKKFKKIIEESLKLAKREGEIYRIVEIFTEIGWENRLKIIPYNVVGHEQNFMIGIKVDKVFLKENQTYRLSQNGKNSIIALSILNNSYQGLIGTNIIKKIDKEVENFV